jgi:glycosyltransferase involved in cell wall biosynthesis
MDETRFDFELVGRLAEAGFKVRLVGTLSRPAFARHPGIEYRGRVAHAELPWHLKDTDALVIPYKIGTFTKGTFPAKIFECFATGKPTVATPLPDLARFGERLYLAKDAGEFVDTLRGLPEIETEEKVRARIKFARANSWQVRFATLEETICRKL